MERKEITLHNAAQCTPYELRQELTQRGAMDIAEDKINFKTLLQRMMVELVKDEEKNNEKRLIDLEQKRSEERDRLKEEREKRKQEALERSKQRREADPQYFENRKQLVVDKVIESSTSERTDPAKVEDEAVAEDDENEARPVGTDPFRSYQPKSRNKIFVK